MLRSISFGILFHFCGSACAIAAPLCDKGLQPLGGYCVTQYMADYIACITASGANRLEIDHEIETIVADVAKGALTAEGSGVVVRGKGAAELSKNVERKVTDRLKEKYQAGAMGICKDVQQTDRAPTRTEYNWRKDADRLNYIYSGRAYCDKLNIHDTTCINRRVGNFTLKDNSRSIYNVVTITGNAISLHLQEFNIKGELQRDLVETSELVNFSPETSHSSGSWYEGTPADNIQINCLSGECVRWTGWQYASPAPGKVEKFTYNNTPIMDKISVALVNNIDNELIYEMRRILARLISDDHSDAGPIACRILCHQDQCFNIRDCTSELRIMSGSSKD